MDPAGWREQGTTSKAGGEGVAASSPRSPTLVLSPTVEKWALPETASSRILRGSAGTCPHRSAGRVERKQGRGRAGREVQRRPDGEDVPGFHCGDTCVSWECRLLGEGPGRPLS